MKTWKQRVIVGFFAILGIAVTFIACDNGNDDKHTHDWGNWIITTFPTETANGIETRTCTIDSTHTDTRTLILTTFQTYFYGTWVRDNSTFVLSITVDLLEWEQVPSFGIADVLEWTGTENGDNDTKDEFPYGFTVSAKFTDHSAPQYIDTLSSPLIFINATKNKLFFDPPDVSGWLMIKQE